MSIYKKLSVKSNIRDYSVFFTDDIKDGSNTVRADKRFFIIDRNVNDIYKKTLPALVGSSRSLIIEASEDKKTLDHIKVVVRHLIDHDVKRGHTLVAIGGGIIQDIAAFTASILFRGIDWIFYPTTLLAQSDSCIGSKTSINVDEYKNQVGNFYPPSKIYLDTAFLKTLSPVDIRSGLGEIIKVHLLDGLKSMGYIEKNYDKAISDPGVMRQLIFRSLVIKKKIIEKDEFDSNIRNIMNYGHTFGHALESLTDYRLCHGQAITIGMDISNFLSHRLGYITEDTYSRMNTILSKNWPECELRNLDLELFFKCLTKDKKNTDGKVNAILTEGPGRMKKSGFALDDKMKKAFYSYFEKKLK